MTVPHNVDDLLNSKLTPSPVTMAESAPEPAPAAETEEKVSYNEQFRLDKEEYLGTKGEESAPLDEDIDEKPSEIQVKEPKEEVKPTATSEGVDEYGNELPKERIYTESEVQKMIQDRLSRGRHVEPMQQPPAAAPAADPAADDDPDWRKELDNVIDQRLETKHKSEQERQWREKEQKVQAAFEAKFATSMQRYSDFEKVVQDKPITNAIMMAARGLNDPAAFLYAASKQHAAELTRIANIENPSQVALEIGKLEERMRKARGTSQAPKPMTRTKGEAGSSKNDGSKPSIDQLIASDAKRKLARR